MQENRRAVWSWAFIDWANSAFSVIMLTALFPFLFKKYWCADLPAEKSTFYLGLFNAASSAIIAVAAPLLGSIADQGNGKKKFLLGFTLLGCLSTALLPLVARGDYLLAGTIYAIAALGFSGNSMFSDALLVEVAGPKDYDRVSSFGFAVGYIGGGVLFLFCTVMISKPAAFGLADAIAATKASFLLTAGWWLLFTLPALLWVRETPGVPNVGAGSVLTRGFRQFVATFRELRQDRRLLTFLAAYVLYSDALNTIIKMASDYGLGVGLEASGIMMAVLVIQFVAFPAAVAFGRLAGKIGPKRCIQIGIIVYAGVCLYGPLINTTAEFFGLAVMIALVQGGVQSLSRSYFARLIPAEKGGEYFGFYNMLGKFAAVLGPALMGVAALAVGNRFHIYSLLVLFAGGFVLLSKVRDEKP